MKGGGQWRQIFRLPVVRNGMITLLTKHHYMYPSPPSLSLLSSEICFYTIRISFIWKEKNDDDKSFVHSMFIMAWLPCRRNIIICIRILSFFSLLKVALHAYYSYERRIILLSFEICIICIFFIWKEDDDDKSFVRSSFVTAWLPCQWNIIICIRVTLCSLFRNLLLYSPVWTWLSFAFSLFFLFRKSLNLPQWQHGLSPAAANLVQFSLLVWACGNNGNYLQLPFLLLHLKQLLTEHRKPGICRDTFSCLLHENVA